jgi:16S rRNA (adenine1518-N6/adenine1519-N6)-dimethyltransferase
MIKSKIGQNFLIDKKVAEREIEYACINNHDVVLEIGSGKGIITRLLAERAKKVIAIEMDQKLFNEIKIDLPKNVLLINDDFLKIDFDNSLKFNKVVSNIPFYISSQITFKLLKIGFSLGILIYQKEYAKRMVAPSGGKIYSRLSVNIYYKSKCKILETINKSNFYPEPKVDSCIVELIPRKNPPFQVLNEELFFNVTRKLFNQRRKKIKNIIKLNKIELKNIPYGNQRVEDLRPEQIGEISNYLFMTKQNYHKNNYN